MNAPSRINSALDVRDQFPAIDNWHYLDSAATAQKPQAVIDAITQAYARDYATVHRGVYERSAAMTASYEAARAAASNLIGGQPNEVVFTRGATEAINLVARSLPKEGRNRVLLSQLEHHSNIVPWQLAGYEVDAVPLTVDGRIDLDAAEAMITEEHRVVAFAHVSNVLGSILDAKRAAEIAHSKGALLLLDGCQAVPRIPVDVAAIGCDFYAYSGHKLYGPTGIGCLWGRYDLLNALPPWQGGGSMIDRVTFAKTTYLDAPMRFEAGTPHIVGAVGLNAAVKWVEGLTLDAVHAHECALVAECRAALSSIGGVTLYGPEDSAGIVSFNVDGVHPHDTATILDDVGVAVRAGHHCAQPLMDVLGVPATARASFAAHSDSSDIEALGARDRTGETDLRMNEERKIETEEVEAVSPPPRARVTPDFERKRDYLTGFLSGETKPTDEAPANEDLKNNVIDALKSIYDPEIPVDIYELGLIYDVAISEDGDAMVTMTLTTPHCPVAESLPNEVELRVLSVPGIRDAEVKLVWDPPWDPSKMSDEARLELGML